MNASHTPGPWKHAGETYKYEDNTSQTFSPDRVFDEKGNSICLVYGIWSNAILEEIENDPKCYEGLANARLISAAPDLLHALKSMHSCHRAFSSSEDWTTLDDEVRDYAEKAISKATGE